MRRLRDFGEVQDVDSTEMPKLQKWMRTACLNVWEVIQLRTFTTTGITEAL